MVEVEGKGALDAEEGGRGILYRTGIEEQGNGECQARRAESGIVSEFGFRATKSGDLEM